LGEADYQLSKIYESEKEFLDPEKQSQCLKRSVARGYLPD